MKKTAIVFLTCLATARITAAADTNAADSSATANASLSGAPSVSAPDTNAVADTGGTNGLRLNFHDAPLGMVLDYLSEKAGYIIVSDGEIRGNVTLESATPVSKAEVIVMLNNVLSKNSLQAVLDGRTLTIARNADAANNPMTPVIEGAHPGDIPRDDTIVTQIMPVHSLNPTTLLKDLESLIPPDAKVSANADGNSLIMTARQTEIHHFAEILQALDSSAVSDVKVVPLKYADAKSVATELKEIFQSPDSTVTRARTFANGGGQRFRFGGGGGGGFPGFGGFGGGGGGGGGGDNNDNSKNAATQVVVTSDDEMNAVIAAAPPEIMPTLTNVIIELDKPVEDVTIVRVFRLKHADPAEMADLLSSLFPDATKTDQANRGPGFQFFRPPFLGGGGGNNNAQSDRMKRQGQVIAVADPRTSSLVVTTSRDLMREIASMIDELDNDPARMQQVTAIDISDADPAVIEQVMTTLFANSSRPSSSSTATTSPLTTREQNNANQQSSSSSTSGFGTTGGGGGLGGR